MTSKIGRNDPCPCGSGKKYKQCCANQQTDNVVRKPHDGAIDRALTWLQTYHRKAVLSAIDAMLFDGLSEDKQDAINALDAETWHGIQINAMEWLLAEGMIQIKNKERRVVDVLLDMGGPLFTIEQRQWLIQLSQQPLRLYVVTDVIPGQRMTLCDAVDLDAKPIVVNERAGSQDSLLGLMVGARLMFVDDHYELSGAVYQFSHFMGPVVLNVIRENEEISAQHLMDNSALVGFFIRRNWLEQFIEPRIMPTIMDMQSSDSVLFITDHYRVKDWDVLSKILGSRKNIEGDRVDGWHRFKKCSDGLTRSISSINISDGDNKIELFHKTQKEADRGRKWFDELAGNAVEFIAREISDPVGMMNSMSSSDVKSVAPSKVKADKSLSGKAKGNVDLHPDVMANLIEQRIHQIYANWSDEPIPALDDKTPREAIATASGLECVKGLIRCYEAGEKIQAAEQGRREISFAFLWSSIGLDSD